jgi:hypothetical protein
MSRCVAPTALRMPISRVRSVTDTSMMFMIPIPPTTRDTAAMAPSKRVMVCVTPVKAWMRSAWFRTTKSGSPSSGMR